MKNIDRTKIFDTNVQSVIEENSVVGPNVSRANDSLLVHVNVCHKMSIPKLKHKMQTETCLTEMCKNEL